MTVTLGNYVIVHSGRLRGERLHEASAGRSSSWAMGEARGHCPLHHHAWCNRTAPVDVPRVARRFGHGEQHLNCRPTTRHALVRKELYAEELGGLLDHDLPTLSCAADVDPGAAKLVTPPPA